MIGDYFLFAINSIRHRKVRSWLTIIGIVIGVAAIISLIMISRGLENSIKDQFEQFGTNRILISPKGFQGPGTASDGFTTRDLDAVKRVSGFKYVSPGLFRMTEVSHNKDVRFTLVGAIPAADYEQFFKDTSIDVQQGRFIKSNDKFVAIVGSRAATDMFDKKLILGNKIEIGKQDFKIIGIWEDTGNADTDNRVSIPLEAAREIFNEPVRVDAIVYQAKAGANIELLQKQIEKELERARDDTNFQVVTPTQIVEQINQVLGIVQIVLVGIATISLLVGAIGIMNSMYTSVLERTKDIGVMKAIGARNSDIMQIFLIESGLMGVIGGIFGTTLGASIAFIAARFAKEAGFLLAVRLQASLLLFGLMFAFLVGMSSGALPAYQASRLRPVDALRHE